MRRRTSFPLLAAMPWMIGTELQAALAGRRLGMVIHSFAHRWRGRYSALKMTPFRDVLDVMDYLSSLGIQSLQIGLEDWDTTMARLSHATCESYGMKLEGIVKLPQTAQDGDRFIRELRLGKEAGMKLFRVAVGGRRYECFNNWADFQSWKTAARRSLELAEPLAERVGVKLAVENHKDFEADELVDLMQSLSSAHVGVCLDTGNSLALLEDPLVVVEKLAPYALTIHLKDIAVGVWEDGFLMAEVPLGSGILDLTAMIGAITSKAEKAEFHLEMITRDALAIPCLREEYWRVFENKSGLDLARTLALVRTRASPAPLPLVSELSLEAKLSLEEKNILSSMHWAAEKLGFSQLQMKAIWGEKDR